MPRRNRILIRNRLSRPAILNIEPVGLFFPLPVGETVTVTEEFTTDPLTLELADSHEGVPIISIWPGDGEVRVEKDGVDVLDAAASGAEGPEGIRSGPPPKAVNPAIGSAR
jgi:hypothetical protein